MTHDTQAARLADEAKRLADEYAHCYAFVGDDTMPRKRTELRATIDALRDLAIPAGEAVAWRVSHPVSGDIFRDTEPDSGVYPPSYTVTPLYASPQPTPEASQDGGGATRPKILAIDDSECMVGGGVVWPTVAVNLRPPLPGRESTAQTPQYWEELSDAEKEQRRRNHHLGVEPGLLPHRPTAQAGAGEDEPVVLSMKRSEWTSLSPEAQRKLETMVSAEVRGERRLRALETAQRAQDMRSTVLAGDAAAPSVLAMREALQELVALKDLDYRIENWDTDSGKRSAVIAMQDDYARRKPLAWAAARAALASTLPEPRADEACENWLYKQGKESARIALHEWAVERWRGEVEHRPINNVNRRPLDDAWRAVIRYADGNPDEVIGPSHDELRGRLTTNEYLALATLPEPRAGEAEASLRKAVEAYERGAVYPLTRSDLGEWLAVAARAFLAASPIATPKPQERKPLTDAQRESLYDQRHNQAFTYRDDFYAGIEAAERHHGIVPQDGDRGEGEGS